MTSSHLKASARGTHPFLRQSTTSSAPTVSELPWRSRNGVGEDKDKELRSLSHGLPFRTNTFWQALVFSSPQKPLSNEAVSFHLCLIQQYVYACRATRCSNALQQRCYFACCVCPGPCRTGCDRMHFILALSLMPCIHQQHH